MKAVYLLPCSCGKKVRVNAGQAGASVHCECGQQLTVPTFRALRTLEGEAATGAAVARSGQPPGWTALRGILFSFGLLVTVIAISIGGLNCYLYSLRRDGGERWRLDEMARMRQDVDHRAPVEIFAEFQEMSKKGLTVDGVPPWAEIAVVRDSNFRWLMAAIVALVLGIASLTVSLFGIERQNKRP